MNKILNLFFVIVSVFGTLICGFNFIRAFFIGSDIGVFAFAILTALTALLTKLSYKDFKTEE